MFYSFNNASAFLIVFSLRTVVSELLSVFLLPLLGPTQTSIPTFTTKAEQKKLALIIHLSSYPQATGMLAYCPQTYAISVQQH